MAMTSWNGDMTQALKWMQANAPNIQSMISQKSDWYRQYHTNFWTDWEKNVFNLQTATPFGLMIWCIILGVPSQLFGLYPLSNSWAYGPNRQNYIYNSASSGSITNPNTQGGNFAGGGQSTILDLTEVRWALQLRYVALISNGRIEFINRMLKYIFNNNQSWNFPGKKYFYVTDQTLVTQNITNSVLYSNAVVIPAANYTLNLTTGAVAFTTAPVSGAVLTWSGSWNLQTIPTSSPQQFGTGNGTATAFTLTKPPGAAAPVTKDHYMEYRIGANLIISGQFLNLLNSPQYGITPSCAGSSYKVIQET
jgi:hypothetical protein